MTFHAQALVRTTHASEYGAQIASELSHEFDTEWAAESGVISLPDGICDMHTWPEGLRLDVFAESREGLARIEEVVEEAFRLVHTLLYDTINFYLPDCNYTCLLRK